MYQGGNPVLNEPFLKNVSMKFRKKRKPFIISLKFRAHLIRAAHILDVENEPPVLKEIPPLMLHFECFFSPRRGR